MAHFKEIFTWVKRSISRKKLGLDNFSWLIEDKLAGSAQPGSGGSEEFDLRFLQMQGIRAIVTLSHRTCNPDLIEKYGFLSMHLPIADFKAPSLELVETALGFIELQVKNNQPVLVHCRGGFGRTGTILACYLIKQGMLPTQAITEVRRLRPGSLEVKSQERTVHQYHHKLYAQSNLK